MRLPATLLAFILLTIAGAAQDAPPGNAPEVDAPATEQSGGLAETATVADLIKAAITGGSNAETALQQLKSDADDGSIEAAIALGDHYRAGSFGGVDLTAAETYYKLAADNKDVKALTRLGRLYREQSLPDKAADFYELASDMGSHEASLVLGDLYSRGEGVTVDRERALSFYQSAYQNGNEVAGLRLASLYLAGEGGSVAEAVSILESGIAAGERGYAVALANAYFDGRGVARDADLGLATLSDSAETQSDAARRLIRAYLDGTSGVQKNPVQAQAMLDQYAIKLPEDARRFEQLLINASIGGSDNFLALPQAFAELSKGQRASALSYIRRFNANSYVLLLQSALKERGYFASTPNGLLTSGTIAAINRFCNELAIDCSRGPLSSGVADNIAKAL